MEPQAPQAQAQQGGGASQLVSNIGDSLMKLMQMVGGSEQVDDDDKQKLQLIVEGFNQFVDGLGGAKAPQAKGEVAPSEAGAAEVKPAM